MDRGSESGEMDAGLQMETGALLLEMVGTEVLEGGVNCPLVPLSELTSRAGEFFFLAGRTLFWPPFCCCCCCCRHLARRFLNHTLRPRDGEGERKKPGVRDAQANPRGERTGRGGDLAGEGTLKAFPRQQRLAGCCKEKLRGSPSLRSLAVITSGNGQIKLLNKVTFGGMLGGGGGRGERSLFAVCQPGTPRNHHLRPIEVKPLIRNNRASEREGTIRETEAGMGGGGKMSHLPSK